MIFVKIEAVEFKTSICNMIIVTWSAYNNSCDLCKD